MIPNFQPTHEVTAMGRTFSVKIVGDVGYTADGQTVCLRDGDDIWLFDGQRVDYRLRPVRR